MATGEFFCGRVYVMVSFKAFNAPAAATARGREPAGLRASASAPAVQFWGAFVLGGLWNNHFKTDLHGMQEFRYGALHGA